MRNREAAASGMTLLELLVALAVFGLVLVTLTALLHFTYGVSASRMHRSEATSESTPALDYLEALIGDARPPVFDGREDQLSLLAPLGNELADAGGLQRIRLQLVDGAVQIAWAPYGDAALPVPGTAGATTLLDAVSDLRFRYFGPLGAGSASGWHDTWDGTRTLPLLVDIVITQTNGRGQRELIVAPRVTGMASSNRR